MCGIAGIIYRGEESGPTGRALLTMLDGCQHRGPDSTGLALYGPPTEGQLILRLFLDADLTGDSNLWPQRLDAVQRTLAGHGFKVVSASQDEKFARITGAFDGDIQALSYAAEEHEGVEIFSAGSSLEIVKDEGTANDLDARHRCGTFEGGHGIGHVRLATESAVNPSTAHPFWAYGFEDIAIVHNGQITNYFKLRRRLEQRGYRFRTANDSELIAVYLADRLRQGQSLDDILGQSVGELDGTFSFLVATLDAIGFAKDNLAAKPMVVFERDDIVAVASEEVSLNRLFPGEALSTYEPFPGTFSTWQKSMPAARA